MVEVDQLADFIADHPHLLIITGAGVSASSGIPTYRDHCGNWLGRTPIQHQEFLTQESQRKRFWSRSAVGWPAVATAVPSSVHFSLARLEKQGYVSMLVTQNVDGLHQKAGHQNVIDLHGRLDSVVCLDCGKNEGRAKVQQILLRDNPQLENRSAELAPDGDAEVENSLSHNLVLPVCSACMGILIPDVVFFGGVVPRDRVKAVSDKLAQVDAVLVVGSSMMVYSGFRFCQRAHQQGLPIAIVNIGKTRADPLATLKLEKDCGITLNATVTKLQADGLPGIRS